MSEPVKLVAKMSMQAKIAELESRIAALEKRAKSPASVFSQTTTTTTTAPAVNLEPEMSSIWKSVEALFAKAFKS